MNRRKPFVAARAGVVCLTLVVARCSEAQLPVPPGLQPGDRYHLAFNSSTFTPARSSDIGFYNTFVQNAADGAGLGSGLGVRWHAIASTATVDARNNAVVGANVPVYAMNLVKIADGFADMWDGTLDAPLQYNEFGQENIEDPWTGSFENGTAAPNRFLGSPAQRAWCGHPTATDAQWTTFSEPFTAVLLPLYALSQELVVLPWADFDASGTVDGKDFLTWQTGFGGTGASFSEGDANGDGTVNGLDLDVWQGKLGGIASATSAAPIGAMIPEPRSWAQALFGVVWMAQRAPRKAKAGLLRAGR